MFFTLKLFLCVLCLVVLSKLFPATRAATLVAQKPKQLIYSDKLKRSPDGKWAIDYEYKTDVGKIRVFVWNAQTKKLLKTIILPWTDLRCMTFSRSGRFFAAGGGEMRYIAKDGFASSETFRTHLRCWDTRNWRLLRILEDSPRDWTHIAGDAQFSGDGKILTTVNHNRTEKWSVRTGKRFKTFPLGFAASMEGGLEARTSRNGSLLLVASGGRLALMQMSNGKVLRRLDRHAENDFLAFSSDERMVVEIDSEGWLRVWDTKTGKTLWIIRGNDFGFPFFSRDSRYMKLPGNKGIVLRDARTGKIVAQSSTR